MLETPAVKRKVQSDIVAEQLEEDIISGRVPGGSRLDESSIALRFGISRTPVREALHALCARSLAERVPYKGVVVAQISPERIGQMFEAMAEVEAICGRLASQRMRMIERAEIESLHQLMNDLAAKGDHESYERANTEFHDLIFRGSHNADLVTLAQTLRLKLAPFRKYQLRDKGRLMRSCSEHQHIVDALLNQDPKGAEIALRRHLISAAQEVLLKREADAELEVDTGRQTL